MPTEAQERRQLMLDDFEVWLKKEYSLGDPQYMWMKDAYGAGDERGRSQMKAAVLDLIKNQRVYQSLYRQIEELN